MRKYENYTSALVQTVVQTYIPEFDRLRDGLLARYGKMLCAPDATPDS